MDQRDILRNIGTLFVYIIIAILLSRILGLELLYTVIRLTPLWLACAIFIDFKNNKYDPIFLGWCLPVLVTFILQKGDYVLWFLFIDLFLILIFIYLKFFYSKKRSDSSETHVIIKKDRQNSMRDTILIISIPSIILIISYFFAAYACDFELSKSNNLIEILPGSEKSIDIGANVTNHPILSLFISPPIVLEYENLSQDLSVTFEPYKLMPSSKSKMNVYMNNTVQGEYSSTINVYGHWNIPDWFGCNRTKNSIFKIKNNYPPKVSLERPYLTTVYFEAKAHDYENNTIFYKFEYRSKKESSWILLGDWSENRYWSQNFSMIPNLYEIRVLAKDEFNDPTIRSWRGSNATKTFQIYEDSSPQSAPETPKSSPQSAPETPKSSPQSAPETPKSSPQSAPETPKSSPQSIPETPKSSPQSTPETQGPEGKEKTFLYYVSNIPSWP